MKEKGRYLIVDDDRANNMLCQVILKKSFEGAEVSAYTEPRAALEYIQNEYSASTGKGTTVLFLDINMPDLTGWEFLDIFKNFDEKIRKQFIIYMLSSSVDYKDKSMAKENPLVDGYIEKPLTRDKVNKLFSQGNSTEV